MKKSAAERLEMEGWKPTDPTYTLEECIALTKERETANPHLSKVTATVSHCRSMNVCQRNAAFNALVELTEKLPQLIQAVNHQKLGNETISGEEMERYEKTATSAVKAKISAGILQRQYAISRDLGDGAKEYREVYLYDKRELAAQMRSGLKEAAKKEGMMDFAKLIDTYFDSKKD